MFRGSAAFDERMQSEHNRPCMATPLTNAARRLYIGTSIALEVFQNNVLDANKFLEVWGFSLLLLLSTILS